MSNPTAPWKTTLLASLLIGALGAVALFVIFSTEPEAQRSGATKKTAMLVEVMQAESGNFTPTLLARGTVVPEREVQLSPRVGGAVLERSEAFSPGGFVKKGEVLLRLDPAPFRIALATRKSELAQAETALLLELGRHQLAQEETARLFRGELRPEEKELMLREPQLAAARETVDALEQSVRQAQLELSWTVVTAPFDAQVLTRGVDVGAQVAPGMELGRLVGVERYWVEATLPLHLRRWLDFSDERERSGLEQGSRAAEARLRSAAEALGAAEAPCEGVTLFNETSWPKGVSRHGCLTRFIGALDATTRLARILITVEDPLARQQDAPPLVIGEFLEAHLPGLPVQDAVRIPRELIRKNQSVWLARDGKLDIVPLEPLLLDADAVYVERGALGGAPLITTHLASVTDGAPVRIRNDASSASTRAQRADGSSATPPSKADDPAPRGGQP